MDAPAETSSPRQSPVPVPAPGVLVSPAWVEERLGSAGLHLVDLREEAAYVEAHLPGAVQLDLARLGTSERGCDNVLLPEGPFTELVEALGIGSGGTVVAYDDQWGLAAARLVWAFHAYGHPAAAALDGGWDRWTDEGRPVTDRTFAPSRGRFRVSVDPHVRADTDWLAARLPSSELAVVDTRTTKEFEAGHLPGAVSWDWFNAVPTGSWEASRDPGELKDEWSALGVDEDKEVVVYCRSGMRAAHTYVVLRHAGFPRVRLYDGSWQAWSTRKPGEDPSG